MKRIIAVFAGVLVAMSFYGCGGDTVSTSEYTLVVQPGDTGKDSTVVDYVGVSNDNCGKDEWLLLLEGESGYIGPVKSRILIQWDISELPPNAIVINARIGLFLKYAAINYSGDGDVEDAVGDVVCVLVTEDWDEDTVTWDDQPAADEGSKVVYGKPPAGLDWERRWWSADVTDFVRAWHGGAVPNYGLCIRLDGTDLGDFGYYNAEFASSEAVLEPGVDPKVNCVWPKLVINYTI